jgi:epoxyqueuosine reductase
VAAALGDRGSPEAVPVLAAALSDAEPPIRGHAAWALGRIGTRQALQPASERWGLEEDPWVREEVEPALR